jgi:predicted MFS family arabinose efflux permease
MLLLALLGLPLLALADLRAMLGGLVLVAIGTFAAQAGATGFVSSAATEAKSTASGLYLASYFSGGIVGSWILGMVFDRMGWHACLIAIALALACAGLVTRQFAPRTASTA